MNRIDEACNLFEDGYVCSQAVFGVFCEEFGLSKMMLSKSQHALAAVCARLKSAEHAPGL